VAEDSAAEALPLCHWLHARPGDDSCSTEPKIGLGCGGRRQRWQLQQNTAAQVPMRHSSTAVWQMKESEKTVDGAGWNVNTVPHLGVRRRVLAPLPERRVAEADIGRGIECNRETLSINVTFFLGLPCHSAANVSTGPF